MLDYNKNNIFHLLDPIVSYKKLLDSGYVMTSMLHLNICFTVPYSGYILERMLLNLLAVQK